MTNKTFALQGPKALSDFRAAGLMAAFRAHGVSVESVSARYVHFVNASRDLTDAENATLASLLTYGDPGTDAAGHSFLVVPRLGTISPWASKASDIVHNCGLAAVLRVERGTLYTVEFAGEPDGGQLKAVAACCHDRMTESVVGADVDPSTLFTELPGKPMRTVPVVTGGRDALVEANVSMGLALSPDEIDYLADAFARAGRDPTDVELMMFAQMNSEHCRHKIFGASWTIDGVDKDRSLFGMIKETHKAHPDHTIVAYNDNAAVFEGRVVPRLLPRPAGGAYGTVYTEEPETTHTVFKVETHNHPTAISPFPGTATGSGGEIRDEGATGRGARPKAGLTGFSVSALRIGGAEQVWENDRDTIDGGGEAVPYGAPGRIATPLQIMTDGPIGGAAFNNEFGRPNILGYFRSFEANIGGRRWGYHKPIMLAGGIGNIRDDQTKKLGLPLGTKLIVLGGPGMRIGLGGGAASSMSTGQNSESLDFDSVQRGNPEMERRAQEVIDRCWMAGDANPILAIHDIGAGGLSNAMPELAEMGGSGARIDMGKIPVEESGMSPLEIWCNESQERYSLAVDPARMAAFDEICRRERCPYAVLGEISPDGILRVARGEGEAPAVDMPMDVLLGKTPKMHRTVTHVEQPKAEFTGEGVKLAEALRNVLRHPTVGNKSFLITIGDRTVGGLVHRDQMVGPWQVPVADAAVTNLSFVGNAGEAMAIGERTPLAVLDAPAATRMAISEAITNLASADVSLDAVKLSANWMAACGQPGEDAKLYDAVEAASDFCKAIGVSIPVGKDSCSMNTRWSEDGQDKSVTSPVSLIVSAAAPVGDVRLSATPQLRTGVDSVLALVDLSGGKLRLGGSILAQVCQRFGARVPDAAPDPLVSFVREIRPLIASGAVLAYHDRSDGGLAATVCEMMFAGHCGASIRLDNLADLEGFNPAAALFAEELGVVLQVPADRLAEVRATFANIGLGEAFHEIGEVNRDDTLDVSFRGVRLLCEPRGLLQSAWSEVSHEVARRRDNPACADAEFARASSGEEDTGLEVKLSFDPEEDVAAPMIATGARPHVAILREQGVNSQNEMAAAFTRAGFLAVDVHMTDLLAGRADLDDFMGLACCGGFSYGDVLGAGGGWAKTILHNEALSAMFRKFFERPDTFALGVCNGCQMMSRLRGLIPGARYWPSFERNRSEQFEARLVELEVADSPSIFFAGMAGSRIPIVNSHGEGRVQWLSEGDEAKALVAARYIDPMGHPTEVYPFNPNGSPDGVTAVTTPDGRFTIMMPHPERVHRTAQMSWAPDTLGEFSPWMRIFRNARRWIG